MLETFENNAREIETYSDNSGVAEIIDNETFGENGKIIGTPIINMCDVKVSDSYLKYTPKSEFINNAKVLSSDDVLKMGDTERVEYFLKMQKQNLEVRKENEQFRQQNFILLCKNRKLEKKLSANC